MSFNWNCPFCEHKSTITTSNYFKDTHFVHKASKLGELFILETTAITCPNQECKEIFIETEMFKSEKGAGGRYKGASTGEKWRLRPNSLALSFPDYVPEQIKNDYEEACKIVSLSPKASATLLRRCLQGIIRDFWQVNEKNLYREIEAIKNNIDKQIWDAINAVRQVGNIGAHMERDVNTIIEVEPHEAEMLTKLIEFVIEQTYIKREEQNQMLQSIVSLAQEKQQLK
ncbi:MAG: DUF4145 domain-containing protein [Pseudomonadota bacterium]